MGNDIIKKQIIAEINALPTLPDIMMRILDCIDDPHSSAEDLKNIIINDISTSSRVLSLANSAYYGSPKEVTEVTRAIVELGFETVIDIALSVALDSMLRPSFNQLNIPAEQLWEHSIAVGETARFCAKKGIYPYKERSFFMGLIHDVGKVALACFFTSDFNKAIEYAQDEDRYIYDTEKEVFGFSHTDVGGWLAENWNLPPVFTVPIKFHHIPDEAPDEFQKEAMLIHLANYLVKRCNLGNSGDNNKIPELSPLLNSTLNISEDDIENLIGEVEGLGEKIMVFTENVF